MKKLKFILFIFALILTSNIYSQSEDINLTIIVKDEQNNTVPGAIILIDEVKQSRVSNSDGQFKIKLNKAPNTITAFSPTVGIKKIKYDQGQNRVLIIIPKGKDFSVVNNVNEKDLNPGQFNTIYDYLRGNIAGVQVEGTTITIRGYNSINGNMTPLFILNGTPIEESTFSRIIPLDIQKLSVLKGTETTIYGIRGANGVIVVETK
ncbi:TonB-dependent receptor plug domain-containing protein [uncultured Polaribacter sp.]|uniref:TonB-dependent receptor plug domain-containing protein n=1 Tax=uncultured Polaribacter sp. TaxID=174711 RepID=UPI0030DC67F0|tara:strand:+ start:46 stop:663 length:618 start_codon:yes stop_codon:yes gene_type:complete